MKRGENLRKHGMTGTPEHGSWRSMRVRCLDPNHKDWAAYGGKGIMFCARWNDFANFYADMGPRPSGTSLDRFPNPEGNYEPGNCRWATPTQQCTNFSRNRYLDFNGKRMLLRDWARELGLSRESLRDRIATGWSVEKALTTPAIRSRERDARGLYV